MYVWKDDDVDNGGLAWEDETSLAIPGPPCRRTTTALRRLLSSRRDVESILSLYSNKSVVVWVGVRLVKKNERSITRNSKDIYLGYTLEERFIYIS